MLMYISKKYAQKLQKNLSFVVILEVTTQKNRIRSGGAGSGSEIQ
jgi:hypothetical protein